jgi:hypothetical protein
MGSNRSGTRRCQRLKRHRKEINRLIKKALAAEPVKQPAEPKKE